MPDSVKKISRQTGPTATAAGRISIGKTAILPWEELDDELLQYAWQPALRFALDCEHAAQRCRRRGCKLSGRCLATVRDGHPLDCGGGLSDETLAKACGHVLFGYAMLRRFCQDFDLVPTLAAEESDEPAAEARPAVSRRRKRR